jgi:hypothetical protein
MQKTGLDYLVRSRGASMAFAENYVGRLHWIHRMRVYVGHTARRHAARFMPETNEGVAFGLPEYS